MIPTPEEAAFNEMAADVVKLADHLAPGYGLDPVASAMACAFAATKMLFRFATAQGQPELIFKVVEIMNSTALKSAADMLAGADTEHQVVQ